MSSNLEAQSSDLLVVEELHNSFKLWKQQPGVCSLMVICIVFVFPCGCVFVVVWLCFCGAVVVFVVVWFGLWWSGCFFVVVWLFLWWCGCVGWWWCDCVFVVVWLCWLLLELWILVIVNCGCAFVVVSLCWLLFWLWVFVIVNCVEKCCREVLFRSVGEDFGEESCREVSFRSVGEASCRDVW